MRKSMAYDLPTRLFHWIFAGLFVSAFFIAKTIDDESPTYAYHMLLGIMLAFTAALRIIWGIVGTRYARFTSFRLHPRDLIEYFGSLVSSKTKRELGHNPASSWAAVAMLIFTFGLAFTGIQMAQGNNKEFFEEIHELFANAFVLTVLVHIGGVVFHTLRHKDPIALSMVTGQKTSDGDEPAIQSSRPIVAILFLILITAFGNNLIKNYDSATQKLNLFGLSLQLGEAENENENNGAGDDDDANQGQQGDNEEDDDDDDD